MENTKNEKQVISSRSTMVWCSLGLKLGGPLQGPGGQESGAGRGAGANKLFLPWVHGRGTDLGRQVVWEWWCWGQEAGQGVLIIHFRTLVQEFDRCPVSWTCQSAVQTNSGIILMFMFCGKMVMGETEESIQIHSSSVHMFTASCYNRMNRIHIFAEPILIV